MRILTKKLNRRELLKLGLNGCLAAGAFAGFSMSGCAKGQKRPNIVLITLDTTRVDRLSCYGYNRLTTPNIDRLAEQSVIYKRAIAPSSWTLPSHASIFTGKFTASHGAEYDPNGPLYLLSAIDGPQAWKTYRARGLAKDEVTLAARLKEAGYVTAAVIGGPWLKKNFGLNKGFDHYDDMEINELNGRTANQVTRSAIQLVRNIGSNSFFLFLNYFDPHQPYNPPEKFVEEILSNRVSPRSDGPTEKDQRIQDLYDGEIRYADFHIGQLLKMLKEERLYERTLVIITSDHGELLGEHGDFGHGFYLHQEEIHIPLILKYPGSEVPPGTKDDFVQLTDIFAMIMNYLGKSLPANTQSGIPPEIGHPVIAEVYPLASLTKDGSWRAIYHKEFKFLWNSLGNHQLYNLKADPGEKVNLVSSESKRANKMMSALQMYLASLPQPGASGPNQQLDEETKKALKSLGYL